MKKFEKPIIEVIELDDSIISTSPGGYNPGTNPPIDIDPGFWD